MTGGKAIPIAPGDVVQIDPRHDHMFGGLLMFVETVSAWGVQGAVLSPTMGPPAMYPYRAPFSAVARVGSAPWAVIAIEL